MSITKALVGLGLIGGTAATTIIITKHVSKKKYAEVKQTEFVEKETEQEEKTDILKKIKNFVIKKVEQILSWGFEHKEQLETAATIVGLTGAVLEVVYNIARMRSLGNLADTLDDIKENGDAFSRGWDESGKELLGCMRQSAIDGNPFVWTESGTGQVLAKFKITEVTA